jgi:hypothetical protein
MGDATLVKCLPISVISTTANLFLIGSQINHPVLYTLMIFQLNYITWDNKSAHDVLTGSFPSFLLIFLSCRDSTLQHYKLIL